MASPQLPTHEKSAGSTAASTGVPSAASRHSVESSPAMNRLLSEKGDQSISVMWMWGDASFIGHSIAKINPLRWSAAVSADKAIAELKYELGRDKYNSGRPVLVLVKRGQESVEQRFPDVDSAMSFLKTQCSEKMDIDRQASPEESGQGYARLILPDGREHKINVLKPISGDDCFLDIRDLHAKTNYFTFDPGFTCTASCMSAITFIDGPKGICLYRGYRVGDLVKQSSALETAFLLIKGHFPNAKELADYTAKIQSYMMVHVKIEAMFSLFTMNAHPMAIMVAVIGGLSSVFSEHDGSNSEHRDLACTRLVAKVPVLAAYAYRVSRGLPVMYPRKDLSFAENWLYMMFASPMEDYKVNPIHAKAIDAFMILHMDHEQNASTSTVRTAGSSQANPYACVAAGVASLWGAAHGGANEAVIAMLEQIGSVEKVPEFVEGVKAKRDGVRLMGFGHRVYKNYDPRAKVMKELVDETLAEMGHVDPLLAIARELEAVALQDEYFLKRKLYPNVDYYSGILLRAIGIPTSMFTVMFAMSRTVGWMAQWDEMISEGQMRITRPRQIYMGEAEREYPESKEHDGGRSRGKTVDFSLPDKITR